MTTENTETTTAPAQATPAPAPALTAEQVAYLQDLFNKFNTNPNHEGLTTTQQVLLADVSESEKNIADLNKQLEALNSEVVERQKQAQTLRDQALHSRGKSDALVSALVKLQG